MKIPLVFERISFIQRMRLLGPVAQCFGLLAAVTAVAGAAEVYKVVDLTGKAGQCCTKSHCR